MSRGPAHVGIPVRINRYLAVSRCKQCTCLLKDFIFYVNFLLDIFLQFQKRSYAKLKWFKCGKKGYGLQLLEDISQGQFLIEYVGEVSWRLFKIFWSLYVKVTVLTMQNRRSIFWLVRKSRITLYVPKFAFGS